MSFIDEICQWVHRILMFCCYLLILNMDEFLFVPKKRSLSTLFLRADDGPTYTSHLVRRNLSVDMGQMNG